MRVTAVLILAACAGRGPIVEETSEPLVLFAPGATPAQTNVDMGYDVEVGVEVWPDVDGTVNGARFYKGSADTGLHVGHLWSASGQLLATAFFAGETASGWQEAHFVPAPAVTAGTHVIVSYHTTTGFSWTEGYYATQRDAAPLHVPAGGGVYAWGPTRDPIFPNQRYDNSSYWVDVDFRPFGANVCAPACSTCAGDDGCGNLCCAPGRHGIWTPTDGPTTPGYGGPETYELGTRFTVVRGGRVRAIRTFKDAAAVASTTGHVWDESGNLLATATLAPGTASGWQEAPLATPLVVAPGHTYVVSVSITHGFAYTTGYFDGVGHGEPPVVAPAGAGVFGALGSFPTQTGSGASYWVDVVFDPDAPEVSLFPPWLVPAQAQYATSTPFELGVKFTTATAGAITHLRFYKGPGNDGAHVGHLWDAGGALLATAPFTGETASGWQEVALPSPVAVAPGAPYVASVSTQTGFAWTMQFFATPYHAPPFDVQIAGGVWASPSGFPTQTYANSNYWVDFAFEPKASTCVPVCIGRLCGDPDTCGGTCLSGGGCTAALDPGVPFWWDDWPRVTNNQDVDGALSVDANLATGALLADEGRGPFFRFHEALLGRNDFLAMQQAGVHALAWLPGQGTSSVILAALHQLPDGTYEPDPATGGPRIVATDWSWDVNGIGHDADANTDVWLGLQSFVNDEPWLGPYTHAAYDPALPLPTYPDGTPALGSIGNASDPRNARLYDGLGTKDLNGNPVPECQSYGTWPVKRLTALIDGTTKVTGYCYLGKDTAAPFWLDYVHDAARFLMRWGVDAIWLDNSSGWHSYFHGNPLTVAFGDWSVATFRTFLASHPTAGVSDPATFDVRAYLKAQLTSWYPTADPSNLSHPGWLDPRWLDDPVWRAYRVHKSQIAHGFASSLRAIVKEEAAAAGRDPDAVVIGGNDIPAISLGAITGDEVDMVDTEYTPDWARDTGPVGRGLPPYGHAGPFYATAVRYGQSRHCIVWYYVQPELLGHGGLGEVLGFEALSSNCMLYGGSFNPRVVGTDASTKKVNDTIARLAPVFGGRRRAGNVAIVYSTETQQTFLAPADFVGFNATTSDPSHPGYLDHNLGHAGWGAALEELHVPYRSIPDFRLSAAELSGVSILVLPHVRAIEASTVENVLVPFLRSGGGIIMTGAGSGSLHTQAGLYAPNASALLDDLRHRDVRPGFVLFVDGNPGFDYHMGRIDPLGPRRTAARTAIATALYNLRTILSIPEEIATTAGPRVVTVLHADSLAARFFVDLANLDLDVAADTLTPAPASTLTWTVPAALFGRPLRVTAYDADGAGGVALPVSSADGGRHVQVTVPAFRVYQTLVLEAP